MFDVMNQFRGKRGHSCTVNYTCDMDGDIRYTCDAKLESKRPYLNTTHAIELAESLFGLKDVDKYKEFESYEDRNFYMKGRHDDVEIETKKVARVTKQNQEFVLKVLNFAYSENVDLVDAYTAIMLYLKNEGFRCPSPVKSPVGGSYYVMCKIPWKTREEITGNGHKTNSEKITIYSGEAYDGQKECVCAVWLLEYVQGRGLHEFPCNSQVLNQCGAYLAKLDISLKKFTHKGFERPSFVWDLRNAPTTVNQYMHVLKDEKKIQLIEDGLGRFAAEVLPKLESLSKQIIHGDWNEHNILASQNENGEFCVTGFLDIGDTIYSYRVFDVAIAMMYFCHLENALGLLSSVEAAGHILAGYQSVFPLSEIEISMLPASIAARFCQSLVHGAYMYSLYPDNEYLLFSANQGWKIFEEFLKLPKEEVISTWRTMCNPL